MADRSWFFSSRGQPQGPYSEARLREFIQSGALTAETLVWTEGMANWQKAGEIPGLLSGTSGSLAVPHSSGPSISAGGRGGALSIELGLWSYLGRGLLFIIGSLLVIPAPWAATGFYRWMASRVRVPGRPNFAFTGEVGDIWYVFIALWLLGYAELTGIPYIEQILTPVAAFLSWMTVRWIAVNLSSNGERLPIEFKGSALGYIGWYILMLLSFITIIGWAWVITAWMRWICCHVSGTRREIVFNATGLETLWRTLLLGISCGFVIPLPWVMRWYTRWYVSQFALVERAAYPHA